MGKRSDHQWRAASLSAAVAAGLAAAGAARAAELKPGDVVFGTSSSNAGGAGAIYVYDSTNNSVSLISRGFFNGVGGLGVAVNPVTGNSEIYVGTSNVNTGAAGRLYVVDPTGTNPNANFTQLGTHQFFNGVGDLQLRTNAYDQATQIVVGARSANTAGNGSLYTVNPLTGAAVAINTSPSTFTNGIGALVLSGDDIVFGTATVQTQSAANLFTVDRAGGAVTMMGPQQLDLRQNYFNSIGGIAEHTDGNLWVGSVANNTSAAGHLYFVDRTTGAATQVDANGYFNGLGAVATNFDNNVVIGSTGSSNTTASLQLYTPGTSNAAQGTFANLLTSGTTGFSPAMLQGVGITAIDVVGPQLDFTGFQDVTIGLPATERLSGDATGQPNWFSVGNDATMSITDLLNTVRGEGLAGTSSVRTASLGGTAGADDEGDLTVATAIDFDGAGLHTDGNAKTLTLRATDDVTLQDVVADVTGDDDSLSLTLIANNRRQLSQAGFVATGVVALNAPVNLGTLGSLTTSGIGFENVGAAVSVGQNVRMTHTGQVLFSADVSAGGVINSSAGTMLLPTGVTLTATDVTLNGSSAATITGLINASGTTTINGGDVSLEAGEPGEALVTGTFVSTGTTYLSAKPVTTSAGAFSLDYTTSAAVNAPVVSATDVLLNQSALPAFAPGGVTIGATVDAPSGGFFSKGTTFGNTAAVTVGGEASVLHTGDVTFDAAFTSPTSFSVTGSNLTSTAAGSVSTGGAASLAVTSDATLGAPLSAGTLTATGTSFTTNAGATVDATAGGVTLDFSGSISTNDTLNAAGDVAINQAVATPGTVAVNATLTTSAAFASKGTDFTNTAPLSIAGAADILHTGGVTIAAAVSNPTAVTITGQNILSDAAGTIDTPGAATFTAGDSVTVGGALAADSLSSTGVTFASTATITLAGAAVITHTGDVAIGAAMLNPSELTVLARDFGNASGPIDVVGPTTLTLTGRASIDASLTTGSFQSDTTASDSSGAFASTAAITANSGAVTVNHGNSPVTLGGTVTLNAASTATFNGTSFDSTGGAIAAGTSDVAVNVNAGGPVKVGSDVTANTFTSTSVAGSGGTFDNAGGPITTTGDLSINHAGSTGNVTLGSALQVVGSGNVVVVGNDFASDGGGTISTPDGTGDVTLTQSGTIGVGGAVDIGGKLTTYGASSFASTGSIATDGDVELNQGTTVSVGGSVRVGISPAVAGRSFTSNSTGGGFTSTTGGDVEVSDKLTLNHAGQPIEFNANATAGGDLTTTGTTFSTTAALRSLAGNALLTQSSDVTFAGAVSIDAGTLTVDGGGAFTSTEAGVTTVSGATTLTLAGPVNIGGQTDTGALTVTAPSIGSTGTIGTTGAIRFDSGSFVDLNNTVVSTGAASDFHSTGTTYDSTGTTVTAGGAVIVTHSEAITTDAMTAGSSATITGPSITASVGQQLRALDGGMTLTGTGGVNAVTLGGGADVTGGDFVSTGSTFNSTGDDADGNTAGVVNNTGSIKIDHTAAVTTSLLSAGTTIEIDAPSIASDGLLSTGNGLADLTATEGDISLISGVTVVGGDLVTLGNAAGGQRLNTVGGAVTVGGAITATHTGDVTTNDVSALAGPLAVLTADSSDITVTGSILSGGTLSLTGRSATVTGTTSAGGDATLTANGGAVSLAGDVTLTAGNFVSGGSGATTFDSAGAMSVFGSTIIDHNGNVTLNTLSAGTSLAVTTTGDSTFVSNDLATGSGTMTLIAPGGIRLNGPVSSGATVSLFASNGGVDVNRPVQLATGNLDSTGIDFDNGVDGALGAPGGAITLPGNMTFTHSGTVTITQPLRSTGAGSTLSFANAPDVVIDGTEVEVLAGTIDFSGYADVFQQNAAKVGNNLGFVGKDTAGTVLMTGVSPDEAGITRWTIADDLYIGGSATSNVGDGLVEVGEHAELIVGDRLKVWANDTLRLVNGTLRVKTLDMDSRRGNFEFFSGTINYTQDVTFGVTEPIARVIGVGSGTSLKLVIEDDRVIEVDGRSTLNSTLNLDGGTFTTGAIAMSTKDRLKTELGGTFNLTNQDLTVGPSGLLSNGTIRVQAGLDVNVTNATKKLIVQSGGLLDLTGGVVNAVGGTTNAGTIHLGAVSARLQGGTVVNTGRIDGSGQVDATVENSGLIVSNREEVLKFAGPGNVNLLAGQVVMQNQGTVEFEQGLSNFGTIRGDGVLRTQGGLTLTNPGNPPPVFAGSGLINEVGGTLNFAAKTDIYGDVYTRGTVISSGGATTSFYDDVYARGGELRAGANSRIVYFGLLRGIINQTGTGQHVVEGNLQAGFSPGRLTGTNTTFTQSSHIFIEADGTTPMSAADNENFVYEGRHSSYVYSGSMTIDPGATIELFRSSTDPAVNRWNTTLYEFAVGDEFKVFTYGSLAWGPGASPNTVNWILPALDNGWGWDKRWGTNDLTLIVSPIPEPAGISTLLVAGAGLLGRRRRRDR